MTDDSMTRPTTGMPTLIDVARSAGVSPMTVSRVVRRTGRVSDATTARVEQAIDAVGYVPNSVARSLRGTRSGMIGLIVPDMTNPYYTTLAHGVETAAREAGITMILANSDEQEDEEVRLVSLLMGRQVDGLVISPAGTGAATMRLCRQRDADLVIVDRRPKGGKVDVVRSDVEGGAYAIGMHLAELGHVRTAVLTGPALVSSSEDRVMGFRRAMREAGAPDPLVLHDAFTTRAGMGMAATAMRATPRPTALFAINNFIAFGALHTLEELGVRVPEDVAVAGFDDLPPTMLTFPFLTVANQPAYEMGLEAVAMLLDRHARPTRPAREVVLATELVIRRSTQGARSRSVELVPAATA